MLTKGLKEEVLALFSWSEGESFSFIVNSHVAVFFQNAPYVGKIYSLVH